MASLIRTVAVVMVFCLFACAAWANSLLGGEEAMKYGVGQWQVAGRGSHRALVQVTENADAVWVRIFWRRPDPNPEEKDVRIFNAQTGQQVLNVVRITITNEYGDLVFQPTSGAGIYEVYYLPYDPPTAPMPGSWWKAWYHKPQATAEEEWLKRNNLTPEGIKVGSWRNLPKAKVLEIQARTEFDRFDPMGVIATSEEVANLLAKFPDKPYLLFPEDRRFPIKLFDHLPLRWIEIGPRNSFEGQAQPGEFFVFQIGVYAARADISDLQVRFSDLKSETGAIISASSIRCFNLSGVDWLGRPMKGRFNLVKGKVRPLWFGIQIPKDAKGTYRGQITIEPKNLPSSTVTLTIKVEGAVLEDCGDSESWRLSRLRWLDSKRGLEEIVILPFVPVKVRGNVTECLNRQVTFGSLGLPTSIKSNGKEILAKPMRFVVETADGKELQWTVVRNEVAKVTQCRAERIAEAKTKQATMKVQSTMEFDGCITFRISLVPRSDFSVRDIRLEVPIRKEVSTYMMGMQKRGGYRPKEWRWKWSKRADNMVWIGEVDAGLQLKLCPPKDAWQPVELTETGIPESWSNNGKGGCDIVEVNDYVLIKAYTGERTLKSGQGIDFHFRLLITPSKPIDKRHWQWRIGAGGEGNIVHIHHATKPENPWINYPFLTVEHIANTVKRLESLPSVKPITGSLTYPADGNINLQQGAVHIWVRVDFDPQVPIPPEFHPYRARFNQSLFCIYITNRAQIGV
ncbi:MAG: glycoside hydrolase domain-containing protein [Armatimonadota bacterium]